MRQAAWIIKQMHTDVLDWIHRYLVQNKADGKPNT